MSTTEGSSTTADMTKVLLITANVGSIFEDPKHMMQLWLKEFLGTVKQLSPDFMAIHCQEVGGKNYEESMQYVNQFVKILLGSPDMQQFDRARIFLDEDFTAVDKFTALGSLYFIHESVQHIQIYDFEGCEFVPVLGREVLSGNIESVRIKDKSKFPQEFFPEFKWSRKGYLRTRWNLSGSVFDLVNIHLFHDASNIVALQQSPSVYSNNRQRALKHTLERFEKEKLESVPYFLFGDFNFRLDAKNLIQRLAGESSKKAEHDKKNEVNKLIFTSNSDDKTILKIGKKEFDFYDHHAQIFSNNCKWLNEYDKEAKQFEDVLMEYPVSFPPSYPLSEDVSDGMSYMKTRIPAWCDRILATHSVRTLLHPDGGQPEYCNIGPTVCMGDHKPIYLNLRFKRDPDYLEDRKPSAAAAMVAAPTSTLPSDSCQIHIAQVDSTKFIHVRQNGAPVRVFRETSV